MPASWEHYLELAEDWVALAARHRGRVPTAVMKMANFWHRLAHEAATLEQPRNDGEPLGGAGAQSRRGLGR
jgi:hypothetical protein